MRRRNIFIIVITILLVSIVSCDNDGELRKFGSEVNLFKLASYNRVATSLSSSSSGSSSSNSSTSNSSTSSSSTTSSSTTSSSTSSSSSGGGTACYADAIDLPLGGTKNDTIVDSMDIFHYRIAIPNPVPASGILKIYTTGTQVGTFGWLENQSCGYVKMNNGGYDTKNFLIDNVNVASGYYWLEVYSSDFNTGTYTIHAEIR